MSTSLGRCQEYDYDGFGSNTVPACTDPATRMYKGVAYCEDHARNHEARDNFDAKQRAKKCPTCGK